MKTESDVRTSLPQTDRLPWRRVITIALVVVLVVGLVLAVVGAASSRRAAVSVTGRSESVDMRWHANDSLRLDASGLIACGAPDPPKRDEAPVVPIAAAPGCRTSPAFQVTVEDVYLDISEGSFLTIERVGLGALVIQAHRNRPEPKPGCLALADAPAVKSAEPGRFQLVSAAGDLLAAWSGLARFVVPDPAGARRSGKAVLIPISGYTSLGDDVRTGVRGLLLDGQAAIREPSFDRIALGWLGAAPYGASYAATEQALMRGDRITFVDALSCETRSSGVIMVDKEDEPGFVFAVHGGGTTRSVHVDRLGQQAGAGFDIDVSWTDRVTGDGALSAILALCGLLASAVAGALLSGGPSAARPVHEQPSSPTIDKPPED